MKNILKNILKKIGIQIKRFPDRDFKRRILLMSNLKIETVLDVGAYEGQYANILRELGYKNKIISFEPLRNSFIKLQSNSINDKNWFVHNYALGDENCTKTINVSGQPDSSSILEMLPSHIESAPGSKYIDREEVEVKRLDLIFNSLPIGKDNVMLKIDAQGFEKNIIDGANKVLERIKLIQLEMSIIPLYKKEILMTEMIGFLDKMGFQLVSLENGFSDNETGQLLQVDGLFVNKLFLKNNKLN